MPKKPQQLPPLRPLLVPFVNARTVEPMLKRIPMREKEKSLRVMLTRRYDSFALDPPTIMDFSRAIMYTNSKYMFSMRGAVFANELQLKFYTEYAGNLDPMFVKMQPNLEVIEMALVGFMHNELELSILWQKILVDANKHGKEMTKIMSNSVPIRNMFDVIKKERETKRKISYQTRREFGEHVLACIDLRNDQIEAKLLQEGSIVVSNIDFTTNAEFKTNLIEKLKASRDFRAYLPLDKEAAV